MCKHVYTHEYTHVCKYNVHLCVCLFVRPRFLAIVDKQFFFDHFVCLSTDDNGDGKGISVRSPCVFRKSKKFSEELTYILGRVDM